MAFLLVVSHSQKSSDHGNPVCVVWDDGTVSCRVLPAKKSVEDTPTPSAINVGVAALLTSTNHDVGTEERKCSHWHARRSCGCRMSQVLILSPMHCLRSFCSTNLWLIQNSSKRTESLPCWFPRTIQLWRTDRQRPDIESMSIWSKMSGSMQDPLPYRLCQQKRYWLKEGPRIPIYKVSDKTAATNAKDHW